MAHRYPYKKQRLMWWAMPNLISAVLYTRSIWWWPVMNVMTR